MEKYMELAEKNILKVYNRMPVVFKNGKDVYLYDEDGKEYLDFLCGIGVNSLGYSNKKFKDALKGQVDELLHISNLFYTEEVAIAAEKLIKVSGMSKAFFTNSGAEAIEGAIKAMKKYSYNKNGKGDYEIIAFDHSFHGRTTGSLAVTGNESYRKPFEPLLKGIKFAEFNNIESVKNLVTDKTIGIIIEPVQGEGGINLAEKFFLKEIEKICNEKDILLILDEIQCGVGRTGSFYRFQEMGIKPDIVATAKALGNGIPVGAFLVNDKVAENTIVPGEHGTTYGGNPLAAKAISTVIDIYEEELVIENVQNLTPYFEKKLDELVAKYDFIIKRKGVGFIQGLQFTEEKKSGEIMKNALDNGLVIAVAENNVVRFLPPLVIKKEHIDEMIEKLERSF